MMENPQKLFRGFETYRYRQTGHVTTGIRIVVLLMVMYIGAVLAAVELEHASEDKEYNCNSTDPPCCGHGGGET